MTEPALPPPRTRELNVAVELRKDTSPEDAAAVLQTFMAAVRQALIAGHGVRLSVDATDNAPLAPVLDGHAPGL